MDQEVAAGKLVAVQTAELPRISGQRSKLGETNRSKAHGFCSHPCGHMWDAFLSVGESSGRL